MATVDRVLPWRRHSAPPTEEVAPLVAIYREHHPRASTEHAKRVFAADPDTFETFAAQSLRGVFGERSVPFSQSSRSVVPNSWPLTSAIDSPSPLPASSLSAARWCR